MPKLIQLTLAIVLILASTVSIAEQKTANSLIQELATKRDNQGGVIVYGKVNLPTQTKLMIEFGPTKQKRVFGQSDAIVGANGQFQSEGFTNGGKPYGAGSYRATVISYFNTNWQSPSILAQTGENGTKLPASALIPDDSEFPNEGRHLEETRMVMLNNPGDEILAIEAVKNAKLVVKDLGKSAEPIKNVVAEFEKAYAKTNPTALKTIGWSAAQSSPGIWTVTLDLYNGGEKDKAQWEYNSKTKSVHYLNKTAKNLSWMPAD